MRSSPFFPHNTTTNQAATKASIFLKIIGLSEFFNGRKKTARPTDPAGDGAADVGFGVID